MKASQHWFTVLVISTLLLAGTCVSLASCAGRELHQAEVEMNTAFRQLLEHVDDPWDRKRLIRGQQDWLRMRETSVNAMARSRPFRLDWKVHKLAMTRKRTEALKCMCAALIGETHVQRLSPPDHPVTLYGSSPETGRC